MAAKDFLIVLNLLHMLQMAQCASLARELVKVDVDCGASLRALSTVTITTDNNVDAILQCKGNKQVSLIKSGELTFATKVQYTEAQGKGCVFNKYAPLRNVYGVVLLVGIRGKKQNQAAIANYEYRYTLTCSPASYAKDKSHDEYIDDSALQKIGLTVDKGGKMQSTVIFRIESVRGRVLTDPIPVGRTIRLRAFTSGAGKETGMRAFDCKAKNSKTSYNILISGCGDGLVIPRGEGFTTSGDNVYSPFISAFRLQGDTRITFECKFVACTTKGGCNGNSCTNE